MKNSVFTRLILVSLAIISFGCLEQKKEEIHSKNPQKWIKRHVTNANLSALEKGKSYLSVYSQIFSLTESKTFNMTTMVSLRNRSEKDTIYLSSATYYDTSGNLVNEYFEKPIFLAPLETTEIVIDEVDVSGGTGSNFIFEWYVPSNCPEPLFEAVMTSALGQQGLSFVTQATRTE